MPDVPTRATDRTFPAVGQFLRRVREARGLKAKDVAAKASMRPAQMTHLQNGGNALWEYYDSAARAMGFKSALDMFTSGGDDETALLLRRWRALSTDAARRDVLRAVKAIRDADEESGAT
jgi:transcriptional regulator with XRE-family HTH domain